MKKIWIDGYEANVPQRLGSGQVAFELLKSIESIDFKNTYTVFLPSKPMADMPKEREGFKYQILKPRQFWTDLTLPIKINFSKQKPDVFFSPTHYIPKFSRVKKINIIFDLSFIHFPQFFNKIDLWKLTNWTKYSVENINHIITTSQSTKNDLLKIYNVPSNKITVSYPGYNTSEFGVNLDKERIKMTKDKYKIDGPFIIFIGTIQPRKNLIMLIDAFEKIENLKLVIVGKTDGEGRKGWMYHEILERPSRNGTEEKVIFTGFVPRMDLPYLLSGAEAFILPSLWEGFGITVVEAMASGTPVIVSNTSSLPEIVGDAGLLIDPKSQDQIEQSIRTIVSDNKLRSKLSKLGIKQAQKFSYKKMVKDVIMQLEKV